MTQIIAGLFLGDADDALNPRVLWNRNIHCIINCTNHEKDIYKSARYPWRLDYHRVGVNDDLTAKSVKRMRTLLPLAHNKIDCHLSLGHAVLVHCERGRQRSACVVASYLMHKFHYSKSEAITLVRTKRPGSFTPFVNFAGSF